MLWWDFFYNPSGNAVIAKKSLRDARTGMLAAELPQGYEPNVAAKMGVCLHGLAIEIGMNK